MPHDRHRRHTRHRNIPYNLRVRKLVSLSKVAHLSTNLMAEEESKKTDAVDSPTKNLLDDFVASGRTGRRNALPDILDEKNATVTTGELPLEMEKLQCSDTASKNKNEESTVKIEEETKKL